MKSEEKNSKITLLDGGMGRELMRMNAPFKQPEWSALSLMETPELVKKAHLAFCKAGSDIITTNNYAVVPFHLGEKRFLSSGDELTALSGKLAREAATKFNCKVAGSIPPIFGSYRPDLFIQNKAPQYLEIITNALNPYVDIWLAETVSSIKEAQAISEVLSKDNRPLWISFTLKDNINIDVEKPVLRSGENVIDAVNAAINFNASAILFNCSRPEVMSPAIKKALFELERLNVDIPLGVYANAFSTQKKETKANLNLQETRKDLDPNKYLDFVIEWYKLGVKIIGGCCGIGPEHISLLHKWLENKN